MPPKKSKQDPRWSIHPKFHTDISNLLAEDHLHFDFYDNDDPRDCIKEYDTNVMGRFTCRNPVCSSGGWSSKRIAITIRLYAGERYNARVYHQRCRECNKLSKPQLDGSYAERVVYRLKKWSGIHMEPPVHSSLNTVPHERRLCEGCKNGHCSQLWQGTD
jgi:hypothetical protein